MPRPRVTGDRNRKLFQSATAFKTIFEKQTRYKGELASCQVQGAPCIIANTYHALISAIGYFKYNHPAPLYLRGQIGCYGTMTASHYRAATPPSESAIDAFLRRYRMALNVDGSPTQGLSTEPLLQHYGVRTRWLDVVDSVPHALFFATQRLVPSPLKGGTDTYVPSRERHGFIYLIDTGALTTVRRARTSVHGYWRGAAGVELADLRKLKPSLALRPHAQHGLLLRDTSGERDLWNRIVARIAVPTGEARQWISSQAFSPEEFFPAPKWDGIFGHLLSDKCKTFFDSEKSVGNDWGEIARYDFH